MVYYCGFIGEDPTMHYILGRSQNGSLQLPPVTIDSEDAKLSSNTHNGGGPSLLRLVHLTTHKSTGMCPKTRPQMLNLIETPPPLNPNRHPQIGRIVICG